jgi:hypothetical protein
VYAILPVQTTSHNIVGGADSGDDGCRRIDGDDANNKRLLAMNNAGRIESMSFFIMVRQTKI